MTQVAWAKPRIEYDHDCWMAALYDPIGDGETANTSSLLSSLQSGEVHGTCDGLASSRKEDIALSMTVCHHLKHHRMASILRSGDPIEDNAKTCSYLLDQVLKTPGRLEPSVLASLAESGCTASLSDAAFLVYTEFLNHFDNLCYYYISKTWYERVIASVDDLLMTSQQVVIDLRSASDLQKEIKQESGEISQITRLIYSDAHQLAIQVEKGEANIIHLIDRVSHDLVSRTRGLTEHLDAVMSLTRDLQAWTFSTHNMVQGICQYTYAPIAIAVFWFMSRSQKPFVRFQLILCLIGSLAVTFYSGWHGYLMKLAQTTLLLMAALLWLRETLFGRSDLQIVLSEVQQMAKCMHGTPSSLTRPHWTPSGHYRHPSVGDDRHNTTGTSRARLSSWD